MKLKIDGKEVNVTERHTDRYRWVHLEVVGQPTWKHKVPLLWFKEGLHLIQTGGYSYEKIIEEHSQ